MLKISTRVFYINRFAINCNYFACKCESIFIYNEQIYGNFHDKIFLRVPCDRQQLSLLSVAMCSWSV